MRKFARIDADTRRTHLIEATARVLAERGTAGATVRLWTCGGNANQQWRLIR